LKKRVPDTIKDELLNCKATFIINRSQLYKFSFNKVGSGNKIVKDLDKDPHIT
jgi:hypothetical protein